VFLKIIRTLRNDSAALANKPDGVFKRTVCILSGDSPNRYCPQTTSDFAISKVSRIKLCSLHRNVDGRAFISWPRELRIWAQKREEVAYSPKAVKIIRPVSGNVIIASGKKNAQKIYFSAEGEYPHYWYVDGKFMGVAKNDDGLFVDVRPGKHKASVLSGNTSDTITFEVMASEEMDATWKNLRGDIIN
jgi:membrane carboxypeptidase/penicillin-binding protein PbpC